jgi:hypothetical protein
MSELVLHRDIADPGMPFVVKQNEAANLLHGGFFSAIGVVLETNGISHLTEQFLGR